MTHTWDFLINSVTKVIGQKKNNLNVCSGTQTESCQINVCAQSMLYAAVTLQNDDPFKFGNVTNLWTETVEYPQNEKESIFMVIYLKWNRAGDRNRGCAELPKVSIITSQTIWVEY